MFKHEKLLFHPVGVEQPNRNMQHCFKNSLAAQTISLLNGHDVDASKVPAGKVQNHVFLGLNPGLLNASGYFWTSDYVTVLVICAPIYRLTLRRNSVQKWFMNFCTAKLTIKK